MFTSLTLLAVFCTTAFAQGNSNGQGQGNMPTMPPRGPPVCENPALLGCNKANSLHGCCAECIAVIMEDFAQIMKEEEDANGDLITYGHPFLKNCIFCAGQ